MPLIIISDIFFTMNKLICLLLREKIQRPDDAIRSYKNDQLYKRKSAEFLNKVRLNRINCIIVHYNSNLFKDKPDSQHCVGIK